MGKAENGGPKAKPALTMSFSLMLWILYFKIRLIQDGTYKHEAGNLTLANSLILDKLLNLIWIVVTGSVIQPKYLIFHH